jgi:RAB6A-GEF complex partner protein 2
VVGVDAAQSGPWGSLGAFRTLNLGSFFGASQPSSLAEMRDRATSKTIPILSTPPSILFVDIRLLPGESRSFSYTFKLPRNLPPSHNGRALRISYSLVVTTQRPGQSAQHLSTAEIPFRLFSNLDGISHLCFTNTEYCHQPKYDLKSPIILLRDQAKVTSLNAGEKPPSPLPPTKTQPRMARRSSTYSDKPIESSQEEFLDFVDHLLGSLGKAPISATEPVLRLEVPRTPSPTPTRERSRHFSCREAIDVAVQRGRGPGASMKSKVGVFEIGKNGVTVAKLTLPRTIYKLGETIEGILELEDGLIRCYQV